MPLSEGSPLEKLSNVITEELDPMIVEQFPETDPWWSEVYRTSEGVYNSARIGRDFKVKKTYFGSVSGASRFVDVLHASEDYISTSRQTAAATDFHSYPNPQDAVRPHFWQDELQLTRFEGILSTDLNVLQYDALPAAIADYMMELMKGASLQVTNSYTMAWYRDVGSGSVFYKVNGTPTVSSDGLRATFSVDNGKIGRAPIGTRVSIYAQNSDGSPDTTNPRGATNGSGSTGDFAVVDSIDWIGEQVTLALLRVAGSTWDFSNTADGIQDNDVVCLWQSPTGGLNALTDFIANSGTVRGMSLTTYPQFKSQIKAVSGPLTRKVLLGNISKFNEQYRLLGYKVDTGLTTEGVLNTLLINHDSALTFEANGKTLDLSNMGFEGEVAFWYHGKKYRFKTTPNLGNGLLYFLNTANRNWKRYVVPPPKGARSMDAQDKNDRELMWVAPALTGGGIWSPVYDPNNGGALTNGLQAPYEAIGQVAPDQIPGIKLTGLTETYDD